jgi:hypothetical protein
MRVATTDDARRWRPAPAGRVRAPRVLGLLLLAVGCHPSTRQAEVAHREKEPASESRGAEAPAAAAPPASSRPVVDGGCQAESNAELCLLSARSCGPLEVRDRCGQPRDVPSCGTCRAGLVCVEGLGICDAPCPAGQQRCCDAQCGSPMECRLRICDPAPGPSLDSDR